MGLINGKSIYDSFDYLSQGVGPTPQRAAPATIPMPRPKPKPTPPPPAAAAPPAPPKVLARVFGYAATYSMIPFRLGRNLWRISPGAFDGTAGTKVNALIGHDFRRGVASGHDDTLLLLPDDLGLAVMANIYDNADGRLLVSWLRDRPVGMSCEWEGHTWAEDGGRLGTIHVIGQAVVSEVTFAARNGAPAAQPMARAFLAEQLEQMDLRELERAYKANGDPWNLVLSRLARLAQVASESIRL